MNDSVFGLARGLRALGLGAALWAVACHRSETDPAMESAEQTFASVCAKCHGSDGKGGVPAAEGANPPRNFCDAGFQASRSDEDLKLVIRKGKGGMPAFGNSFSDAELRGLVRKIRCFNPASNGH